MTEVLSKIDEYDIAVDNIDKHEKMIDALYKEYQKRVDNQLKAALPNIKRI